MVQVYIKSIFIFGATILSLNVYAIDEEKVKAVAELKVELPFAIQLKAKMKEAEEIVSASSQRRAYKKIIRDAEKAVKKSPESESRFEYIALIFECQKATFTLQPNVEHQKAIVKTARVLQKAPDKYAKIRVEADVLFLQMALSQSEENPENKAVLIAELADRYRNTPGEAHSLILTTNLAFELGNRLLLKAFKDTLSKRFGHDPDVVAFMRDRFASNNSINFNGVYNTADNKKISFPMGQPYLLVFWSNDTPMFVDKVKAITSFQTRYKSALKVYSFNLDEMPDSAKNTLRRLKLDWVPMKLTDGIHNPLFVSLGTSNLYSALLVNSHGLAQTKKVGARVPSIHRNYEEDVKRSDVKPLLASLYNGEFLIKREAEISDPSTIANETLEKIRACFVFGPDRYQLSAEKVLENFKKARSFCVESGLKDKELSGFGLVNDFHIMANLGLWRSNGLLEHLESAIQLSKETIAKGGTIETKLLAHFVLSLGKIVKKEKDASVVLKNFIAQFADKERGASVYSAALVLAVQAHLRKEYQSYKNILRFKYMSDSTAYALTSLLYDEVGMKDLFEGAFPDGGVLSEINKNIKKPFEVSGVDINKKTFKLPSGSDKIHISVFYEGVGDKKTQSMQHILFTHLNKVIARRPLNDIEVTCVFKDIKAEQIEVLMKKNKSSFKTIVLNETEWSVLASEYGIFSYNHRPNIYITDSNASVIKAILGVRHDITITDKTLNEIDISLKNHDLKLAEAALVNKDYLTYAARIESSFPLKNRRLARHEPRNKATMEHRRKLVWAYMQMKEWDLALQHININLVKPAHKKKIDPKHKSCKICYGHLDSALVRSVMLKKLGRVKEAEAIEALIKIENCPLDNDVKNIFADIQKIIDNRLSNRRFSYLKDPSRYLAYQEKKMRENKQALDEYKIENDYMMRSVIYKNKGNEVESEKDKLRAEIRAWPYKVKEYDLYNTQVACDNRRALAVKMIENKKWQEAIQLVQKNINNHESEALRCNSTCKICDNQANSFRYQSKAYQYLKDHEAAEKSLEWSRVLKCPSDSIKRESFHSFPVNRMYACGPGKSRLKFIDSHMRGKTYANALYRKYRFDLAHDLLIRSEALKALGKNEKSSIDLKRATALTYPYGPKSLLDEDVLPDLYIDVLNINPKE